LSPFLLTASENRREVVGTYDANGGMLRRSDQLLLTPENDHFEGSMHLKAKEGTNTRLGDGGGSFFREACYSLRLEKHATFKVIVLRCQEELVAPSQHGTIRIICPHDSAAIFIMFEQD